MAEAPIEFLIHLRGLNDDPAQRDVEDSPDSFSKFQERAGLAGIVGWARADGFSGEARRYEPAAFAEMSKILGSEDRAEDADDRLQKHYSGENLSGYRQWFAKQRALGKSGKEALDEWLVENPDHSDEVEALLRQVAVEF